MTLIHLISIWILLRFCLLESNVRTPFLSLQLLLFDSLLCFSSSLPLEGFLLILNSLLGYCFSHGAWEVENVMKCNIFNYQGAQNYKFVCLAWSLPYFLIYTESQVHKLEKISTVCLCYSSCHFVSFFFFSLWLLCMSRGSTSAWGFHCPHLKTSNCWKLWIAETSCCPTGQGLNLTQTPKSWPSSHLDNLVFPTTSV